MASLAESASINRSSLFRYEKGEKSLSDDVVVLLFSNLGLKRAVIFKMFVLWELLRLRRAFGGDDSTDEQIDDLMSFLDSKNVNDMYFSNAVVIDNEKKEMLNKIYQFFKDEYEKM